MEDNIIKTNNKKKKLGLLIGIITCLIILMGSTYAFFTYYKSIQAFVITSSSVSATFTSGSNRIDFQGAYPISDEYAITNIDNLTYIDFTVSGLTEDEEVVTYEIFLTEKTGNTLSSDYVKVYLTDQNKNKIVDPKIYSSLELTSFANEPTGRVIYKENQIGTWTKNYRLYVWLDKDYEQNTVSQTFSFYVNIYAHNNLVNNLSSSEKVIMAADKRATDGSNCLTTIKEDEITYISGTKECINFNYVWYSGKMWRIIAIYPDGTMKLITDNMMTSIYWNRADDTNYNGSWIYQWLNEDFYDTLINPGEVLVTNATWNYSNGTYTTNPITIETQRTTQTAVGLLNGYEYYKSYKNTTYRNGYLNNDYLSWLLNGTGGNQIYGTGNNYLSTSSVSIAGDSATGVRPSVVMKSDVLLSGNGTKNMPYKVVGSNYNSASIGDNLNSRFVGEYVNFDGDLYRIVSTENSITKLIRMDYLRDETSENDPKDILKKYLASSTTFAKSTNTQSNDYWDYYLTNTWYNAITSSYKNMLVNGTYYQGVISVDKINHKRAICSNNATDLDALVTKQGMANSCSRYSGSQFIVGLPRYGEMFATQQAGGKSLSTSMWLITPYGGYNYLSITADGGKYFSNVTNTKIAVRPTINLSSSVTISGGTGLENDPYTIQNSQ